jgi:hypothetical protein
MEQRESQVLGPGEEVHEPTGTIDRICIDLDGVLAESVWPRPEVGRLIPEGRALLRRYAAAGFEIIIFTSRPEDHKQKIWDFLLRYGMNDLVYEIRCNKPLAQLYIDDKAYRPDYVGRPQRDR